MKKFILGAIVALPLVGTGALADVNEPELMDGLTQAVELSDQELRDVQGGAFDFCFACLLSNTAVVTQLNISVLSAGVFQNNASAIFQSNN